MSCGFLVKPVEVFEKFDHVPIMPSHVPYTLYLGLFLLSTIASQVSAVIYCSNRYFTLPEPNIEDCRYILSKLPSLRARPEDIAKTGNLTLTLGPLRRDPFELPTQIRHDTCWISAHAYAPQDPGLPAIITEESEYFHVWTWVREQAAIAIRECLEVGWPFASYRGNFVLPGYGQIGLKMTVGRLSHLHEYTSVPGLTTLRNI